MKALFLLFGLTGVLAAQGEMVSLSGWRMLAGDEERWAAPDLDDSGWQPISAIPSFGVATMNRRSLPPVVWYRTAFHVPSWWIGRELAVGIWKFDDAYEVFANGRKIGELGSLPLPGSGAGDHAVTAVGFRYRTHAIPAELTRGGEVRIAIRRWILRGGISYESHDVAPLGPSRGAQVIGLATTVTQAGQLHSYENYFRGLPGLLSWIAILVCGLFCLRKWNREHSVEYLWLGLALLGSGGYWALSLPMQLTGWPKNSMSAFAASAATTAASSLFFGWFLAELAAEWRRPLRWASLPIAAGTALVFVSSYYAVPDWTVATAVRNVSMAAQFAICVAAAWVVWRSGRGVLLPIVGGVGIRAGVVLATGIWNPANYYLAGPFVFSLRRTSDLVIALGLVWLFHTHARRERVRRRELASDLDAARRIQETLLGADGETPGFAVEPVYIPATEVGGDFYQAIPGEDGSLLVLVGDVSGKGLRAAMLAGSVIGSLRNEFSRQPGEVLAHLNRSLLGRNSGGFVTCCCARIDADGSVTLANAGHLAPYRNGIEIEVEPGLPLGVAAGAEYGETRTVLGHAALVLVSDGVVEAANAAGELFGFDRTRDISTKAAKEIADAARAWGQNDDITVVTVRRNV